MRSGHAPRLVTIKVREGELKGPSATWVSCNLGECEPNSVDVIANDVLGAGVWNVENRREAP